MINQASGPTRNESPLNLNFQLPQENPKDEEVQSVQELKSLCHSINFLANGNTLYCKELNGLADSILKKVATMQLNGSKSEEILAYSKKSINKLQTAKDNFHNSKCTFKNNSLNFINQCTSLKERIDASSNFSFNSSAKPAPRLPTPEELMRGAPYWPDQREKPTPSILEKRSMFQIGQQSADIYAGKFSNKLQTTKDGFDNSKIKIETKSNFINQYNLLEKKLNTNSLISSKTTHKTLSDSPTTPEEMMKLDPDWQKKQNQIQGSMNTYEAGAAVITYVGDKASPYVNQIGNNIALIGHVNQFFYNSVFPKVFSKVFPQYLQNTALQNEVKEQGFIVGNYLAKEAKYAFETISKTEFIVKACNFFAIPKKGLGVNPLEKYFFFSKEEVKRFDENSMQVMPYVIPYGTVCKGMAVPFRAVTRTIVRSDVPKVFNAIVKKTHTSLEQLPKSSFKKPIKIVDLKPTEFTSSYAELPPSFFSRVKRFLIEDAGSINLPEFFKKKQATSLIAERLNATAEQRLYFPSMSEIHKLSLGDLHAIWETNNKTLIGIIAENNIPRFGFHGTTREGVQGLLHSKIPKGSDRTIYVAGYKYSLDPITDLADMYTIRNKALGYLGYLNVKKSVVDPESGIFVLDTSTAIRADKPMITSQRIFKRPFLGKEKYPVLPTDSPSSKSFINLVERDGNVPAFGLNANGQITLRTDGIINAAEYKMTFDPHNFNSRVKGVILSDESFYLSHDISLLHKNSWLASKGVMAERFKTQEIVVDAFEKLKILNPADILKEYTKVGESLLENFHKVTHIPLKKVTQLDQSSNRLNNINREIFYGNRAFNSPLNEIEKLDLKLQTTHLVGPKGQEILSKTKFTHADFGNVKGIDSIKGHYSQSEIAVFLEIEEIQIDFSMFLNYQQLANEIIQFAQKKGAKKIILEIELKKYSKLAQFLPNVKNLNTRDVIYKSGEIIIPRQLNLLEISLNK